jgi:hypothetical protein
MNGTYIEESVVKTRDYSGNCYRGKIAVFENHEWLWSKTSEIVRIFRCDAMNDATAMAKEARQAQVSP